MGIKLSGRDCEEKRNQKLLIYPTGDDMLESKEGLFQILNVFKGRGRKKRLKSHDISKTKNYDISEPKGLLSISKELELKP